MIDDGSLVSVLADAQAAGFLGRAPLEDHVRNGLGFVDAIESLGRLAASCADLGSGGGVPGLVIACASPAMDLMCIDRGTKRCEFLRDAVERLDLTDRVRVVQGDAEDVARAATHAASFELVTARSFGPPAVAAEAGARLLAPGGALLVSEPPTPEAGHRWDAPAALAELGLRYDGLIARDEVRIAVVRRTEAELADRYPRRSATVRKRPLF